MTYHFKQQYLLLILVAVSISIYFNSLRAEKFLIDDTPIIEEFIQNDYSLYEMIRIDKGRAYKSFYDGSYRPLFGLSLWIDFSLWFDGTRGYHLTNLLLHVLSVILTFFLSQKIWEARADVVNISFFSALIFSVHPIHTEAVDWISGRQDPMATLFTGLSLLVYLRWKDLRAFTYPVFASIFFLLGLLSRETSLALIPILVIYELTTYFYRNKEKGVLGLYKLFLTLPLLLVIVISVNIVQHQFASYYQSVPRFGPLGKYLSETSYVQMCYENIAYIGYYLSKLFFPAPLNFSTTEIYFPLYFFFSIVSLPFLIYVARKDRVLMFLLLSSIFSILPNLPAQFFSWTVVAERYLYLSSLFFSIGVGFFISKFLNSRTLEKGCPRSGKNISRLIVVGTLLLLMSALTVERNWQWQSNDRFWKNAVKKNPDSPAVLLKYAGVLGGNYVRFRGEKGSQLLLNRAPLIKLTELLPGNGYEEVERIVKRAEGLGDKGGYIVLAAMAKADEDSKKVVHYLDKVDAKSIEGGSLLTFSMMWVYLSKNVGDDNAREEEVLLKAITYLKKYVAYKKKDHANVLKIARLYMRILRYEDAAEVVDTLLTVDGLSFIQRKAALRLRKKIEELREN